MTCIAQNRAVATMISADPAAFFALSVGYEPDPAAAGDEQGESETARLGAFAKAAAFLAAALAI